MSIKLLNKSGSFSPVKKRDLDFNLEKTSTVYRSVIENNEITDLRSLDRSLYVNRDEIFLIEVVGFDSLSQLKTDQNIIRERDGDRYLYYSTTQGYLALRDGVLTILDPVFTDDSRLKQFFIFLPVEVNINVVKDDISGYLEDKNPDLSISSKILIREAVEPVKPVDAYLEWIHVIEDHPPIFDSGKIDYKSWSRYQEVKEDDVIVIKHLKKEGVSGVDVLGNIIPVPQAQDVDLTIDEHIWIEEQEGILLYRTNCTGLFQKSGERISIKEFLHIDSDVGYETGNINFSRDIEVDGDVKSGFSINCGGNLYIKGTVESGVWIDVKGDLKISKGILGEDTEVRVGGSLQAEFIQDSYVRADGDITVLNSIYHAKVFSASYCSVLGKKIRSNNHGSIVGGRVSSMKGLKLHSVGALASKSDISCGIDEELKTKVKQLKEVLPVLVTSIIKMQKSLNLNRIKHMDHLERELYRTELMTLKKMITQKDELEKRVKQMSEKVVYKDLNSISIDIKHFILEDNKVSIGDSFTFIKERKSKIRFSLEDGVISTF